MLLRTVRASSGDTASADAWTPGTVEPGVTPGDVRAGATDATDAAPRRAPVSSERPGDERGTSDTVERRARRAVLPGLAGVAARDGPPPPRRGPGPLGLLAYASVAATAASVGAAAAAPGESFWLRRGTWPAIMRSVI